MMANEDPAELVVERHYVERGREVDIHRAEPDDAPQLKEIMVAAKGYWGYPERWLRIWADRVVLTPEDVRDNETYIAVDGDEFMGFYLLMLKEEVCILDHLWVVPDRIGTGVGRALFSHALQRTQDLDASRMEFECDAHAVGFYRRMGARHLRDTRTELEGVLPVMAVEIDRRHALRDSGSSKSARQP